MVIPVKTTTGNYPIYLERGGLEQAGARLELDRRVLIVTDDGVPKKYAARAAGEAREPTVITLPQGEKTKSLDSFRYLLSVMAEKGFTRTDCVMAVGGGVMGDLAGFVASAYMRGVDFYNVPTTLLSQVDSSIGGKVAVDFGGYKNLVGAFYQPKAVLIDPDTLSTLPDRQFACGMAEAVKTAVIRDEALFDFMEQKDAREEIDAIIEGSLLVKKSVVEQDEKEAGLRKILNFGHTIAHAIEAENDLSGLNHGECVAIGMIPMCAKTVRRRLVPLLEKLGLPTAASWDPDRVADALRHDKKLDGDKITVVMVEKLGAAELVELPLEEFETYVRGVKL